MSLSTLTQCHPQVCHIQQRHHHDSSIAPPTGVDCRRVQNATKIATVATLLSQLVTVPLDVASQAIRYNTVDASNTFDALLKVTRSQGVLSAFQGLPFHFLKRVPTKALTVALFEVGTQLLTHRSHPQQALQPLQHMSVATLSGATALLATYPLHLCYYSVRKGVTLSTVLSRIAARPRVMYAGAIPALLGTAPAIMVDYAIYRGLRKRIADKDGEWRGGAASLVAAAATANLLGGFMSEPFKAVSRRVAVECVRGNAMNGVRMATGVMLQNGLGEFWRGFRTRSMRYAVSAVVSKSTVQHLKGRSVPYGGGRRSLVFVPPRKGSAAAHLVTQTRSPASASSGHRS